MLPRSLVALALCCLCYGGSVSVVERQQQQQQQQQQQHLLSTSTSPSAIAATGRFALQRHDGEGWVLHRPDGTPTFLLALNHLVRWDSLSVLSDRLTSVLLAAGCRCSPCCSPCCCLCN
jgi:hypothetical protein